jgi:MFS transporter, BCD family, chlorophyll transporter
MSPSRDEYIARSPEGTARAGLGAARRSARGNVTPRRPRELASLTWLGIARLGLVQAMLGSVVVLTTSTLNRVMAVELMLPALIPGLLVALHYAVQLTRPRMGFGSDVGSRRTPWIVGGIVVLALGGFLGAVATASMTPSGSRAPGLALAALAFVLVGLGVSAAGTSLLTLLAKRVDAPRRAGAAALVWTMMIVGFAVTAGTAGAFLDPYSPPRLVMVSGTVSLIAVLVTMVALWRLEGPSIPQGPQGERIHEGERSAGEAMTATRFRAALAEVWCEPQARRFTIFVFVSMLAFSAQDLILEPFAGLVFGYTPGESTQLSGVQHGGTLAGMLMAALAGRRIFGVGFGSLRSWTVWGCVGSCVALAGLAFAGFAGESTFAGFAGESTSSGFGGTAVSANWPLRANVFLMGVANGAFSIAAIGSMMALAGHGKAKREGTRMGLWGAAQAIGFAGGGVIGTSASDLARWLIGSPGAAYACVFAAEAVLFIASALLARRIDVPQSATGSDALPVLAGARTVEEAT